MRSFEERKTEVFRRSENRIKERRKKCTRMMTVCFSICVILIICTVVILPEIKVRKEPDNPTETFTQSTEYFVETGVTGETGATGEISNVHSFISVSVKSIDGYRVIEEYFQVTEVFNRIYDIYEANGGYKDIIVENNTDSETETTCKDAEYVITMKSVDGNVREYRLNENVLYDTAYDTEIVLTENQLMWLKLSLGIKQK